MKSQNTCSTTYSCITIISVKSLNTQTYILYSSLSLGVKRPGREADHSPPPTAAVKECVELYLHTPNTPSWRGDQLKNKAQGRFYLLSFPTRILKQHKTGNNCL
jgi:hypothetical protein